MEVLSNGKEIIDGVTYATKLIRYSNGKRVIRFFAITSFGISRIPAFIKSMS